MKTYTLLFHSGKVEVLTDANPKKALEYLVDNHEYIEVIYIGELVDFANPSQKKLKEQNDVLDK